MVVMFYNKKGGIIEKEREPTRRTAETAKTAPEARYSQKPSPPSPFGVIPFALLPLHWWGMVWWGDGWPATLDIMMRLNVYTEFIR